MSRRNEKGISFQQSATIREQNIGVKHVNLGSILKARHLQRMAIWASKDAKITALAAFFGSRLAAESEASGIPVEPSIFLCKRCETILQPGINCTIRIEKNTSRKRKLKKSETPCQNNVVYTCHFCSHRNLKWGTTKHHVKGLVSSKQIHDSTSSSFHLNDETKANSKNAVSNMEFQKEALRQTPVMESLPSLTPDTPEKEIASNAADFKNQTTPLMRLCSKSGKKRKISGSTANKAPLNRSSATIADSGNAVTGSSKRRRKGWSSLKEIVESYDSNSKRSINNYTIPFLM